MAWRKEVPRETGDFFYTGPTPDGTRVVAIVQVFDNPNGSREACLFLPPNWRGLGKPAILHHGKIEQWVGEWDGPEYGLCCVTSEHD